MSAYLSRRICKSHLIAKTRIVFHYLSFLFHSLCPFVTHVGEREHPQSHVMAKFQQPHSDVPLFLLFYICHQAFRRGLLWEPCWREICLCTLTHTCHADTRIYTYTHTDAPHTHTHAGEYMCGDRLQGPGMTVRNVSRGLWSDTSRCLCRCQPWETLRPRRAPARG